MTTDIILGTMYFGTRTDEATSRGLLDRFADLGGRWLDTADCYAVWADPAGGHGHSERVLGRWLTGRADSASRMRISTKVRFTPVPGRDWPQHALGLSRDGIVRSFDGCCERLGVESVDMLWAHAADRRVPLEETVAALGDLVAAGRVDRLGASNHAIWRVERARRLAADLGVAPFTALQLRHSVVTPRPGRRVDEMHTLFSETDADYAVSEGLDVWAYSPLVEGALFRTDKTLHEGYEHPGTTRVLAEVRTIAAALGATPNQVVLAWLMQGDPGISPIVGVSSTAQLDEAMAARDIILEPTHFERIEAAR